MRIHWIIVLALIMAGCATGPDTPDAQMDNDEETVTRRPQQRRISLAFETGILGNIVRSIGEESGGGVVLMHGLEDTVVENIQINNAQMREALSRLAEKSETIVHETPHYYFILAPGFEVLNNVSLRGELDPIYNDVTAEFVFGYDTPLFMTFAWISHALDMTIVGDNEVAEARSGELALGQAPLATGLEALLKSSRSVNFHVDSTEEYIFIYSGNQGHRQDMLLNDGDLTAAQQEVLDRRVDVFLPEPPDTPDGIKVSPGAQPLGEVLDTLSRQLGVLVVAEPGLDAIPVNPAVFRNVRVSTALDLLIRQWLMPIYGYEITHDRIVIRQRRSGEM